MQEHTLEERKLKEIEHSRQRRSILQGFERHTDTNPADEVSGLNTLVRDNEAFDRHFSNMKFYSIARASERYYQNWLKEKCPGSKALDYCCGNGENAIFMAQFGADAIGIDISSEGIENCKQNAIREGVESKTKFLVMDAEALGFPDNSFDVIHCYGVLHHLDFPKAMSELRRVLKPQGAIICVEALRHNPFFHLYRKLTPHLRTEWEVEHILTVQHLNWAREYFDQVHAKFFHLVSLAAVPFRKTSLFNWILHCLESIDRFLLAPQFIGKYGWMMVFVLEKPKKN